MDDILGCTLRGKKHPLFLPYFVCGYPDIVTFQELVLAAIDAGADGVEVGIPHSDPVADGPVIQAASQKSLEQGFRPRDVLAAVEPLAQKVPLVAMTYTNIVYRYGVENFGKDFSAAGFKGLIVADCPLEHRDIIAGAVSKLSLVQLASTSTGKDRLLEISKAAQGFLYLVSGQGITGKTEVNEKRLRQMVVTVRGVTDILQCIGFGVGSPQAAASLREIADGVIVGTSLIQFIARREGKPDLVREFSSYLSEYRRALDNTG